jgi:hypothetical protein
MRRLSRLIALAALAGAVGLGVAVTTQDHHTSTTAGSSSPWDQNRPSRQPTPQGHYWS